MRSKLFSTVLALVIVGPFAYFVAVEAIHIKQHLQEQHSRIKSLTAQSLKLDKTLVETKVVKDQTVQEVQQLQQQADNAVVERKNLETELGTN